MRRTLIAFTLVTILAGVFVLVKPAAAQDGLVDGVANAMINAFSSVMISIAGLFIQLTIFALKFFIEIAGYNNYIDADVVQIGWNMVRDIANMFFVVVLLVIAFGTILGLEQYEWKKTLVKLVMAAFFVNFSNLICQLIIDIGQIFTITFLNALAGAAGGNLIKMFNFDEIYNIASRGTDPTGIQLEFFAGSVMTIVFAGIAMFTMGAYLIVMIGRMVVLWTLMILSPLAFLFSALPNTQSYAQEFWNEFIHHVIVAPVMVFFLWLAFATFGGGNIVQSNIEANNPLIVEGAIVPITESTDASGQGLGASFSAAASWENMANFAVAIAFLWMGVERVQKLGVVGGGIVSGALNFGKNVATVASGLALARWMGGGAKNLASGATKAVGKGLYDATIGNRVEIIGNRFKREVEGWKSWRAKGPQPRKEVDYKQGSEFERNENGKFIDENGNELKGKWKEQNGKFFDANGKEVDDKGNLLANGQKIQQYDPDGNLRYRVAKKDDGSLDFVDDRGSVQKWFYKRNESLLQSRKNLDKVKKERDTRDKLVDKRVTAVPRYFMQGDKDRVDGMDRLEQGMLEAEDARSAAKTKEFKAMGKELVMNAARFKDGEFQTEKGSIAQQEAGHVEKAKRYEELVKQGQSRARRDFLKDKKNQDIVQGRISGSLEVKALDTEAKRVEAGLTSGAMRGTLANLADFDAAKKAAMAANGGVLSDEDKEKFSDTNRDKFNVLDRQIAAEKQEHSEGIKQQGLNKNLEAQYLAGPHGTEELEEEARIKAGIAANEAFIKTAEENAEVRVKGEKNVQDADRARINAELAAQAASSKIKEITAETKADVEKNEGRKFVEAIENSNLKTKGAEAESAEIQGEAAQKAAEDLKDIFSRINLAEQAKKAADDFVKGIKDKELAKKFNRAAQLMNQLLNDRTLDSAAYNAKLTALKSDADVGVYIKALSGAQLLKRQQEITSLRTKQAEDAAHDAYVQKPMKGTTASSTVYSDYSESKMKDYRKLERIAGMKKATDTLAFLMHKKANLAPGEELEIDQTAEMYAASAFLQEEAWNDDQAEYIYQMFKNLQAHQQKVAAGGAGTMSSEEEAQWKNMALKFKDMGWLEGDTVGTDGSIKSDAVIRGSYNRKNAADLQNIAITGGDSDLVRAHNIISQRAAAIELEANRKKDEIRKDVTSDSKNYSEDKIEEDQEKAATLAAINAEKRVKSSPKYKELANAIKKEKDSDKKQELESQQSVLMADIVEKAKQKARDEERDKSIERQTKAKVDAEIEVQVKPMIKTYWEIAEAELPQANIGSIANIGALKKKYEEHHDLLQDATRNFKKNSFDVGHEELGQNQDFDETENLYRFQTKSEAQAKIRADRVKIKMRQLINTDQYHSNGTLDFDTGIIDDFIEDTISLTLGKVQKLIELTDIPERSLKGHAYIHKNEDASVEVGNDMKLYGVIGGEAAQKKFKADGHVTVAEQTDHMLTKGILAELMSGDRGWALGMSKLFNHVDEGNAKKGVVNVKIGEEQFRTTSDIAKHILAKMDKDADYLKKFGSSYEGQEYRVMKKLQNIIRMDGHSIGGDDGGDDDAALGF